MNGEWIGVDLDGTLAVWTGWVGPTDIGEPIEPMVRRVRQWLAEGRQVRIFTARVFMGLGYHEQVPAIVEAIQLWTLKHVGQRLPVTCSKDFNMLELWDDRAVQLVTNTGLRADGKE